MNPLRRRIEKGQAGLMGWNKSMDFRNWTSVLTIELLGGRRGQSVPQQSEHVFIADAPCWSDAITHAADERRNPVDVSG